MKEIKELFFLKVIFSHILFDTDTVKNLKYLESALLSIFS